MDLSIIILNYNTCDLTLNALKSVYASKTLFDYEVIVVDNNSSDHSVRVIQAAYPNALLIANQANLGFSKGNNVGIRVASGRYILLLNSDTEIQADTLDIMVHFMDQHPSVGAAGCKVVLPGGTLDKACKRGFPTPSASFYYAFGISRMFPQVPKFNQYQLGYLDPDKDYAVDCLVGAFMMVRKEAINKVGLLDEEFFMYGEDIDWCYRIKQSGWQIYYYPHTQITHHKGASSRRKPFKIIYEFHRAMYLFHKKHYGQKYFAFINYIIYLGIFFKFIVSLLQNRITRLRG
jgi:GT2 family glycosyltransferase